MGYGGLYVVFLVMMYDCKRLMSGRIIGEFIDVEGKLVFCMVM